jgi:4-diphosphocytidyl-2-C-methyl-D-erythritol kinase
MRSVTEFAFAKINLFLGITEKRSDGFHGISTLMQTVSLCDTVTVSLKKSLLPEIKLKVLSEEPIPEDQSNLAYRAAEAYFANSDSVYSISILLEKRIPSQAGLAGGSSDAAAVLRALDRLAEKPIGLSRLLAIAGTLGSDIPFCLLGGAALCTGRGEILAPIPDPPGLYGVIVKSKEAVSTPFAYAALDRLYRDFDGTVPLPPQSAEPISAALASGDPSAVYPLCYNLFEEAVFPLCPVARSYCELMRKSGALAANLSGSGSAVFGLFRSRAEAEAVAAMIGDGAVAVESVGAYLNENDRKDR